MVEGKTFAFLQGLCVNITVREIHLTFACVPLKDEAVTAAGEGSGLTDFGCHILGDIPKVMAVVCQDLDGVPVISVGRFLFEGADKFADVFVHALAKRDTGYPKLQAFTLSFVLWPHAYIVAIATGLEIL
jgi:hypothetical protein